MQASLQSAQIVARGQGERRGKPLDVKNCLLQMLRPHRLEFPVYFGHGLNDSSIMNTGELESTLAAEGKSEQR